MKIRSIEIKNYGNIEHFEAKPGRGISVVQYCFAKDAMLALAGSLSYPTAEIGDYYGLQRQGFNILLQVDDVSECDKLNNINKIPGCREALRCRIFLNDDVQKYDKRLFIYKKCDDYYEKEVFDKETDRLGHMKFFRKTLCDFIRDFKPFILSEEKNLYAEMLPSGEFIVKNRNTNHNQTKILSRQEQTLFRYICFLEVNRFWDEIASIRDVNPLKMPLLATNFIEFFYPERQKDVRSCSGQLNNQLIIFTDLPFDPIAVR